MEAREADRGSLPAPPPLMTLEDVRTAQPTEVVTEDATLARLSEFPLPWLSAVAMKIDELIRLPENWDSYGGRPVSAHVANRAMRLLQRTMRREYPAPEVVPTTDGSLQLEWHVRGLDLEVTLLPGERLSVTFEDRSRGEDAEFEVESDLQPLVEAMTRLESRV